MHGHNLSFFHTGIYKVGKNASYERAKYTFIFIVLGNGSKDTIIFKERLDRFGSMTYTTQELIEILDRELKANWKGQRIVLSSEERINDPVVSKLLDMEKVSKVFAYQDFRRQIHEYQKQHQVSGIIWRDCSFQNQVIRYPEIYNQLIPIDGDKETLIQAKNSIIDFWRETTATMKYWLVNAPGKGKQRNKDTTSYHEKISPEYVDKLINQTEWAEIDAACNEIYLGLCWGDPLEYCYQWAKPKSGCDRIIASNTEPSLIKI